MGFSWQEYQSGLPCPPPGDLPDQGIKPVSRVSWIADRFFTSEPPAAATAAAKSLKSSREVLKVITIINYLTYFLRAKILGEAHWIFLAWGFL